MFTGAGACNLILHLYVVVNIQLSKQIVIFLDFHSTKQGLPLVDSWSHGLD